VARVGSFLGYRVTVCDARPPVFATSRRFPDADEVVVDGRTSTEPDGTDERPSSCVLTHDPKFDVPLLEIALRLPLAYVGRWGRVARTTPLQQLRERGLTADELDRCTHDRADVGGPHPGGDRRLDRGRDRRSQMGRHRHAAA